MGRILIFVEIFFMHCMKHKDNTMKRVIFFLSLFILCLLKANANAFTVRQLGLSQGLSNNCVNDISQDKIGTLWFATEEGLNRFDGRKFIPYYKKEDFSITGNELNCLLDDPVDSILWIGTQRAGLNAYDYVNNKFIAYRHDDADPKSIITDDITDIAKASNGNFWISTYWKGVEYFNKANNEFVHYNTSTLPGLVSDKVWTVLDAGDGNLYVGHVDNGLSVISLKNRVVQNYVHSVSDKNSLPGNEVRCIFKDNNGNIWAGTNQGIALFDSDQKKFISYNDRYGRMQNSVSSIIQINNELWVGMEFGGVAIIDLSQRTFVSPEDFKISFIGGGNDKYALSNMNVRCLFQDSFNNIWLGVWGGDVNFIGNIDSPFCCITGPNPYKTDFTFDNSNILTVSTVSGDENYVSTNGGSIYLMKDGQLDKSYRFDNKEGGSVAQTSLYDPSGYIWYGLFMGGVQILDLKKGMFLPVQSELLKNVDVRHIYRDADGYFWLSTSSGIYKLDRVSPFKLLNHFSVENNLVRCLSKDGSGNLLVGTFGSGLIIFDDRMNLIKKFQVVNDFPSNTVNQIYVDSKGKVWIATGEGLVRFDDNTYESYKIFNKEQGLENIHIRSIIEDDWENYWISTNRGISCLEKGKDFFLNYSEVDMVLSGSFNSNCVSKDADGMIYFGSTAGLCYFSPINVLSERKAPLPFISSFTINEPLYSSKKSNVMFFPRLDEPIRLDYSQNNFSFSISVKDYAISQIVEYAYMLKGFDSSWYIIDDPNNVIFRNIPYGNYQLIVRTRVHNHNWSDEIISMPIIIRPPVWFTWWAKVIYVILTACIFIYALYLYRKRLNLSYSYKIEKQNYLREQELNQEKLRFYTNITHELRTPLTLIIGPLEDLVSQVKDDKVKHKLSMIYQSALKLLKLINQILEFRKTETQNRRLCVSKGNIASVVYEVGLKYKEFNRNPAISLEIVVENENISLYFDKDVLTMILDNLLSNSFKYTPSGYIRIKVGLCDYDGRKYVEICVCDSGYGISEEAISHIFDRYYQEGSEHQASGSGIGLALVKNLIELHHARISVKSKKNEGTEFRIYLLADYDYPDELHDENESVVSNSETEQRNEPDESADKKPIVLFVEDNEDIRAYVNESLSDDFEVKLATNGKVGLDMAVSMIPDVVVSDIMMPEMDGFEMCRSIKNNVCTCHIPIILLTAKDSLHDKEEGYTVGADSYITKPFSASLLKIRIKNLIETRKSLSEKLSKEITIKEKRKIIADSTSKLDNDFLVKFNNIIESNLSMEKLDVSYIADKLCMSNSTLYRKIKALTGLSTNEYVKKIKMKHAERLLLEGKYNISEIAFMIGMNSTVYFRQCFKEEFGVVPSDYVKKIKG